MEGERPEQQEVLEQSRVESKSQSNVVPLDELQQSGVGVELVEVPGNPSRGASPRRKKGKGGGKKKKKKSAAARRSEEIQNLNEIPYDLQVWNLAAFCFQFISCVPLFWLASTAEADWHVYTNFPYELQDSDEEDFDVPNSEQIAKFSLTWYSAVFILMSGVYHLSVALPGVRAVYEYYVARHQNPFRWLEYTFSASLMRIMIAQLAGITDLHTILCIFIMAMTTMTLGACHESVNAKARADGYKQNWFPYFAAWIPQFGSWIVILWYFFVSIARDNATGSLYATIFLQILLDASFAFLFHLQWAKKGIFKDYVAGEKMFIVLSFFSKAFLAWMNLTTGGR